MSTTKHTPGPWFTLSAEGPYVTIANVVNAQHLTTDHYVGHVTEANGDLVAAAPELQLTLDIIGGMINDYLSPDGVRTDIADLVQEIRSILD